MGLIYLNIHNAFCQPSFAAISACFASSPFSSLIGWVLYHFAIAQHGIIIAELYNFPNLCEIKIMVTPCSSIRLRMIANTFSTSGCVSDVVGSSMMISLASIRIDFCDLYNLLVGRLQIAHHCAWVYINVHTLENFFCLVDHRACIHRPAFLRSSWPRNIFSYTNKSFTTFNSW